MTSLKIGASPKNGRSYHHPSNPHLGPETALVFVAYGIHGPGYLDSEQVDCPKRACLGPPLKVQSAPIAVFAEVEAYIHGMSNNIFDVQVLGHKRTRQAYESSC